MNKDTHLLSELASRILSENVQDTISIESIKTLYLASILSDQKYWYVGRKDEIDNYILLSNNKEDAVMDIVLRHLQEYKQNKEKNVEKTTAKKILTGWINPADHLDVDSLDHISDNAIKIVNNFKQYIIDIDSPVADEEDEKLHDTIIPQYLQVKLLTIAEGGFIHELLKHKQTIATVVAEILLYNFSHI